MSDRTPVLIGTGQVTYRGAPARSSELSPAGFATEAARRACADAGVRPELIDRIAAVRMTADNVPPGVHPFGSANNFPRAVARRIGANPREAIYGVIGGQSPQDFVNECAEALFEGACEMALIVAAEATGLERAAQRAGLELEWSEEVDGDCDDRGPGSLNIHPVEVRHGLFVPVTVYSLIEHAQRARAGRSREAHAHAMAELFAGFSRVAAANPLAQFPVERSAEFLAHESGDNYRVSDPYLKWLVAQDAVSQGAAVLMTTEGKADQLGVPREKRVYLHGYGSAADLPLIEREDLGASKALKVAAEAAFEMADADLSEVGLFDIYSCFPCAVVAGVEALGIGGASLDFARHGRSYGGTDSTKPSMSSEVETRTSFGESLTVTGGLPFFGGAGNGYSLFAIAEMARRLRDRSGALGLVTANGGFMSKESVGLYGTAMPERWRPSQARGLHAQAAQGRLLVETAPSGIGTVESFTIGYAKGTPSRAAIIGRTAQGARFAAGAKPGDVALEQLMTGEPIGRRVAIEPGEKSNGFRFID